MSVSLGLVMTLSVSRLGQGQAREAGTEKSDVSGANLSRAKGQLGLTRVEWQAVLTDAEIALVIRLPALPAIEGPPKPQPTVMPKPEPAAKRRR